MCIKVLKIAETKEDGTTKIDIDWEFLEVIYQHTEEKKHSEIEKPVLWHQDEEEEEDLRNAQKISDNENEPNGSKLEEDKSDVNDTDKNNIDKNSERNDNNLTNNKVFNENDNKIKDEDNESKDVKKSSILKDEIKSKDNSNVICREIVSKNHFYRNKNEKGVKKMNNPLLKNGEIFVFDPEKYREAVVTPWYRNQDLPQVRTFNVYI